MRPHFVLLIVLMAAVTYTSRVGLIGVAKQFDLHSLLRRALDYVPVSILAALVFPAVFAPKGTMESPVSNIYVWSALLTAAVWWISRKQWLAILIGVASLVVLRQVTI